jgi:glycosyltransferase involved in cell wall biosynthesis
MLRDPGAAPRRKVLFLTKYGRRAASTRYRVLQYLPFLDEAGFECETQPLLSDRYLARKLDEGRTDSAEVVKGVLRRVLSLRAIRRFALVVIHMEALPYLPPFFEKALAKWGVPYVYDFDDASFHQYDQAEGWFVRWMFSEKIRQVIEGATLVTAGNEYLADYARAFNRHVVVVPTVVDVDKFVPRPDRTERACAIIGWIGSPSTAAYVVERQHVWHKIAADHRCAFRLVGAGHAILDSPSMETRSWHEQTEALEVRDFDIGIMPLRDDPWSRGKCGFKLIQYLACGLPVVASPVGVNSQIVVDGETGFLCESDEEWIARLSQLVADPQMRRSMGDKGREDVRQRWSLQRWGPEVARLLADAANGTW